MEQARHGERLDEEVTDAVGKIDLLNGELAFNESLVGTLERLQTLGQILDLTQRAIIDGRPLEAVKLLEDVSTRLPSSATLGGARVADVLGAKVADFRKETTEKLTEYWNDYLRVEETSSAISIHQSSTHPDAPNLASVAGALSQLGMFDHVLLPLSQDIERLVLLPRLQVQPEGTVASLLIEDDAMSAAEQSPDLTAQSLFSDLNKMVEFLRSRLPPSIMEPLAGQLIPLLISKLISTWLASSVPEGLDGMDDFQDTMALANTFANTLREHRWPGTRELADWMGSISDIWLRKRQQTSLGLVRKLLSKGFGTIQTVERIETEVVKQDDEILGGNGTADEWNADWSDEDPSSPVKTSHTAAIVQDDGEEDVSAWGLDDEKDASEAQQDGEATASAEDDADTWGWNEDDHDGESKPPTSPVKATPRKPRSNGVAMPQQAERAVTLKETYNITSLPNEILQIISQVMSEASTLESPSQASFPVASAAPALLALPGLLLAMYRASASSTYTFRPNGSMYLYNDSLWLAEQLQHMSTDLQQTTAAGKRIQSRMAHNLNLEAHIAALESHGKRAYAKEMESQRTIITDLLDGTQGFSHCTEHPFNQECDIAIASTVDRLRLLHKEWKVILSQSALLQSLGSLLTTVTSKMIVDIEDMSDISEPESQLLTTYCSRVAALEDLFVATAQEGSEQAVPATAFYTPNWFKFQYLANILESSLIDIKYMWTESELALEFQTEELIDLVLALFADSAHRRTAIGEIRTARR